MSLIRGDGVERRRRESSSSLSSPALQQSSKDFFNSLTYSSLEDSLEMA
eukprot:CAMPEP_0204612524 /NCGR_PEP_ID=MMETSP0717-20131115/625_1 /ASSEMBLY_ACC=CAM_ASM_000666 /TAXON_ID=230516 /ORGANISM="Chaetoceros curvisetus" /LENGTH=48 /DNA_ID= /DNA_START= /DNA_END= /DNA_ORIENTATION=